MLYHLFFLLHTRIDRLQRVPLHHVPDGARDPFGALISFLITPRAIKKFQKWNLNNGTREDVPDRHEAKKGTPTMGGAVILIATIIPTLLWADLTERLHMVRDGDARHVRRHRVRG